MKLNAILTATCSFVFGLGLLPARTWKSADGTRTLEGELGSYDANTGNVVLILDSGHEVRFTLDKLSQPDREFLAQKKGASEPPPADSLTASFRKEGVLKILKNGAFAPCKLEGAPKFFLLYFSASW